MKTQAWKKWVGVSTALIIPVLFLIIGFFTISDYGITTDECAHFLRGEAYFHYFLTGKKDYSDLSAFEHEEYFHVSGIKKSLWERRESRNIYQNDSFDFNYWVKDDGGHPPLNAILSSLTVEIFYKRLGILGNVDAHHSIIVILGAVCILAVYLFANEAYGRLAGLIAALSLSLYPFFLVASHNKIKEGPETAFFTLTVWSLWKGLKDRNWKWILTSSLFCGCALGTKFNIVFLPFIVLPWFLVFLRSRLIRKEKVFSRSLLVSFFFYPLISLFIVYASWPWLWPAPLPRLLEVVGYYKTIGTTGGLKHWDMIVLSRAIFRTPFPVLLLSSLGIGYALTHFWKEKNKTLLLVLFWLLVPIIRGIAPGMTVYGSIHRVAEYIPPLCILAGLGAKVFFSRLRYFLHKRGLTKEALFHYLAVGFILLLFIPHLFILVDLHPNEDMYFNCLIGGIKGAREKGMIDPVITIGNIFLQGVKWLNEHAEKNAVCDVDGLASNIQPKTLRDDIELGRHFSDLERKGEYLLFQYETGKINPYTAGLFPEVYLKPIYQIKAQNVPIFNIYKNDVAHTYPGMVNYTQLDLKPRWFIASDDEVEIDLGKKIIPCKIEFIFSKQNCVGLADGLILSSSDYINWKRDAIDLPGAGHRSYKEGYYTHLLSPPQITQFFKVRTNPVDAITCYQKIKDIKVWALTDFIYLPFASYFSYPADAITSMINIRQSGKYALVSRRQGFSTDFTIGGKKVEISFKPRILESGWVVYNESVNLSSGNYQARLSMPHFQSPNLIVNPSFEEKDIAPWSGTSDIVGEAYQEKFSLRLSSAKNSKATLFQAKIPGFEKSKYYFYSFRYKAKSGQVSTGIWQPPYGHYIKPVKELTGEKNRWENHQEIFYPAPKTEALDIYVYLSAEENMPGEALFDDFVLRKISPAEFSDDLWLVSVSNFSIEEMLDSLERLKKL